MSTEMRNAGRVAFFLTVLLVIVLPLWFGANVFTHSADNWFAGYGFTPVTPRQAVVPASFTPASVTWTVGEVAQR